MGVEVSVHEKAYTVTLLTMSSYYQPPSSSYGVPQSPPLDSNSWNNNPSQQRPPSNIGTPFYLYQGYEDDIYLLVKLGEGALIVFIIFAIVAILYMIINCCLLAARNNKK